MKTIEKHPLVSQAMELFEAEVVQVVEPEVETSAELPAPAANEEAPPP
jgi:hypothetical protein